MTGTLSPEQTQEFRAAQRRRNGVILAVILVWIVGMFALTLVKGHLAVAQRMQQETHE